MNSELLSSCSEMVDCFNEIAMNSDCRVVVLSGAGKFFTAGTCQTVSVCNDAVLVVKKYLTSVLCSLSRYRPD